MQRGRLPILDVHRNLDETRTRQVEPERAHARKAAAVLAHEACDLARNADVAAQVDVEGNQRPAGADDHAARRRMQLRGAEVGRQLAVVDPLLETFGSAPAEVRGAHLRRRVDEHGQLELACNPLGDTSRDPPRALEVARLDRNDRHDVGRTDPRMSAFMAPQIDALDCDGDRGDQRVGQLTVLPDEREDGPVVIGVRMHVEHRRVRGKRRAEGVDRHLVASFAEVRHGLEWEHAPTLGAMKEYYDRRAPEYDDWYLGHGKFAERVRPEWEAERARLIEILSSLPPRRTLDVACGTGFLTQYLPGDVTGLDQSERMLQQAARQAPQAMLVRGDALQLPFDDGSFERIFTGHFYGHLEEDDRRRFLAEAARLASEIVVVDSSRAEVDIDEEMQTRELDDGSRWEVYKRWFTGDGLARELGGGDVLLDGRWFVAVRTPL